MRKYSLNPMVSMSSSIGLLKYYITIVQQNEGWMEWMGGCKSEDRYDSGANKTKHPKHVNHKQY